GRAPGFGDSALAATAMWWVSTSAPGCSWRLDGGLERRPVIHRSISFVPTRVTCLLWGRSHSPYALEPSDTSLELTKISSLLRSRGRLGQVGASFSSATPSRQFSPPASGSRTVLTVRCGRATLSCGLLFS